MRYLSHFLIIALSVLLMSCTEEQRSTCIGESKIDKADENLSDISKYFVATDFNQYVGHTVSELVNDFEFEYEKLSGLSEPPTNLVGIQYSFPENYAIKVYLFDIKYTERHSLNNKWEFEQIGKEKISGIKVIHFGVSDYYCEEFGDVWF